MLVQHRTIGFQLGLTILVVLILVLAGCRGAKPTATPTPEVMAGAATPAVTILRNPNITIVPAGGQVALAAEATGVNLKIAWRPKMGKVSNTEGPSTIYTAPATPGIVDTVDVTVASDTGSTIKTVTFTVVEASAERPAPSNTTPISTRSPTVPTTTVTPAPTTAVTPLAPPSGLGRLTFNVVEGCDIRFNIYDADGNEVGEGQTATETLMGAGTYDIGLMRHSGGWELSRLIEFVRIEDVTIQEGQDTVIDLSQKIGAILVSSHPTFETRQLGYDLFADGGIQVIHGGAVGGELDKQFCLPPGKYRIVPEVVGKLTLNIEIGAGKKKDLAGEIWGHLGRISVLADAVKPRFKVYDQATGEFIGEEAAGLGWWGTGWIVVGEYRIVLTDPYPGYTYENVEIRAGEETVLQLPEELPDQSSP